MEEMVEEEKVYVLELNTQNMSEANLKKAEKVLTENESSKHKRMVISGEPYY